MVERTVDGPKTGSRPWRSLRTRGQPSKQGIQQRAFGAAPDLKRFPRRAWRRSAAGYRRILLARIGWEGCAYPPDLGSVISTIPADLFPSALFTAGAPS